ncbi:restriction endonuclease subunit S [Pseudozobellia thermophila]|uniref:Type I restriction enzyme, S subunit n=1 Tax=Pseudozobellia thermophila TaxID=192903 RepID=A0A1M6NNM6_9FLAO|nr:restriction endonuclease subunit S [Pseudozobellia thermophila]SHJ97216.1 type I restriction enzyme, S subunit [Pseudozobellia thermophila]
MSKILVNAANYSKERISLDNINVHNYVTTDNLLQNKQGKVEAEKMPKQTSSTVTRYDENDILIANIRPYLKKIWFANCSGGSSSDVLTLKVKKGYSPKFIYYSLFRDEFFDYMMTGSKGTKMPRGDKNQILDFPIPDFELDEQKQIAKVLSDLDAKIEVNNKINQELEALAKTIYDYWFVQFDFPDQNGKPYKSSGGKMVYNEQLKREIPEGWEVKYLGDLVDCNKWNRTKETKFSRINYLDTSNLTRNVIDSVQELIVGFDKIPSRAQRIVSPNDILYSTVRPNQEHFGIIKSPIENLVASTGFAQIQSKNNKFTNDFIYQFLCQDYVTVRLQKIAEGSVSAYPSISHNDIMDLKIVLPIGGKIIEKANTIFSQYNEKIALNLKENQKLSELRDWLLPMLMNGQATVRSPEKVRDKGGVKEQLGMVAEEGGTYKTK